MNALENISMMSGGVSNLTNSLVSKTKDKDIEKAAQAAEDFESFFLSKMMDTMFEGISTDGMFGGGSAEKIYRSLLINEYGKVMAKSGSVGVSDSIMDTILKMQEAQG